MTKRITHASKNKHYTHELEKNKDKVIITIKIR